MIKSITLWILNILGIQVPHDVISYDQFIQARWYYEGIPGFVVCGLVLLGWVVWMLPQVCRLVKKMYDNAKMQADQ